MKSVPIDEIKDFNNKMEEKKMENEKMQEHNKQKLYESWKKNKDSLPQYMNPMYKSTQFEKDKAEIEENKRMRNIFYK